MSLVLSLFVRSAAIFSRHSLAAANPNLVSILASIFPRNSLTKASIFSCQAALVAAFFSAALRSASNLASISSSNAAATLCSSSVTVLRSALEGAIFS